MSDLPPLGSHLPMAAPSYYLSTAELAISLRETALMFYTGAPQNSVRADIAKMNASSGQEKLGEAGILLDNVVIHAPYIVNPASRRNEEKFLFGVSFLIDELRRASAFGSNKLVVHPGSHLGDGLEYGLHCLAQAIDLILQDDGTDVTICLETMAGKGKEVGVDFAFFASLFPLIEHPERVGLCLDTCHLNDAGFDLGDFDKILDEIESRIGLDKIKVIHLNDSKSPRGSHLDRHENIGYGTIGFDILSKIYKNPKLKGIPFILETPLVNGKMPYAQEMAMLRSGAYVPAWREGLL